MRFIVVLLNPKFVDIETVIAIHEDLILTFEGVDGRLEIRDRGLLESAISQPQATFFGQFLHPTIAEQAAAYLYHIANNHAFIDGNKRTAVAIMEVFLRMNGYNLNLTDEELEDLVRRSLNELDKEAIANTIKSHLITFELNVTTDED